MNDILCQDFFSEDWEVGFKEGIDLADVYRFKAEILKIV
jgi:hypothetical protein